MTWDDSIISMKRESEEPRIVGQPTQLQSMLIDFLEEDLDDGFFSGEILPSAYDYHDVHEVAQ